MPKEPRYPIESVGNALTLLRLLEEEEFVNGATVGERIGVARSTAHRLLAMLEYYEFVHRDKGSVMYTIGPAILRLALNSKDMNVQRVVRPVLVQLMQQTGETAHFVILREPYVMFMESVECRNPLRVGSRTGDRELAHRTATGKAIIAQFDEAKVDEFIMSLIEVEGAESIDVERFRAELETVRARGYATNLDEAVQGVRAVGAAIIGRHGEIHGAISIGAPSQRLPDVEIPRFGAAVGEAVREVAQALDLGGSQSV